MVLAKHGINATKNPAWQFAISVNPVSSTYHGQDFKGDACCRLLKSIDKLEAVVPPTMGLPFVKCLRDLNTVVVSCFSVAGPEGTQYMDNLDTFYESATALFDVSFTRTFHGIVEHVKDFFVSGRAAEWPPNLLYAHAAMQRAAEQPARIPAAWDEPLLAALERGLVLASC